jgi:hypothetical protein
MEDHPSGIIRQMIRHRTCSDSKVSFRPEIILVVSDRLVNRGKGGFITFDIRAPEGLPTTVRLENLPTNETIGWDGLIALRQYASSVALSADDLYGTRVFGSRDGWNTVEYIGGVPRREDLSVDPMLVASTTDHFELDNAIYQVTTFFDLTHEVNHLVPPKRKSHFPMIDITAEVHSLVDSWRLR